MVPDKLLFVATMMHGYIKEVATGCSTHVY